MARRMFALRRLIAGGFKSALRERDDSAAMPMRPASSTQRLWMKPCLPRQSAARTARGKSAANLGLLVARIPSLSSFFPDRGRHARSRMNAEMHSRPSTCRTAMITSCRQKADGDEHLEP